MEGIKIALENLLTFEEMQLTAVTEEQRSVEEKANELAEECEFWQRKIAATKQEIDNITSAE